MESAAVVVDSPPSIPELVCSVVVDELAWAGSVGPGKKK
jgi:hypothetical protein